MQRLLAACLALLLAAPARGGRLVTGGRADAGAGSGHPVEKVIGLLQKLMQDAKKEGEAEEYSFTKFSHWCKTSDKALSASIAEAKEKIDELSDTISAKKEEISALTKQLADLDEQLLGLDKDNTEAETIRKEEESLYERSNEDLKKTIDAIGAATEGLENWGGDSVSLVQAQAKLRALAELVQTVATAEQQGVLREFAGEDPELKERPEFKASGDEAEHIKKYAFKSEKVIELLKQLKQKFEADLLELVKSETNAVNAYTLANAARMDEIKAAKKAYDIKDSEKSDAEAEKGTAEEKLLSTQQDLESDSDALADATKLCETKADEWEERQKIRGQELEAMQAAIKILAKVTGVRTEAPENPVPPPSPIAAEGGAASFLQVRGAVDPRARAVELLRTAARDTKSRALERFAQEMSAHLTGPFDEVNGMIEKMIFHLMAEQKDEDDHKNWCDLELNKTDASIEDKLEKMKELQIKIDEATTYVAELTTEIAEDNEMVAKIDMHMKESAEIREVGKKENAAAIKDAQEAQEAIANAIAVLETHYKETGMIEKEPYELLQRDLPAAPSTWDASYTGVTDPNEGRGIITMLKSTNELFAKMETKTSVQEETDEMFYKKEMSASEIEKATRLKDAEVKGEEKKRQVEKAAMLTAERKHVSDEHEATEQYLSDLQKACVDGTDSYEGRKANRAKEIEALHEAKDILKDAFEDKADVSLLHKSRP